MEHRYSELLEKHEALSLEFKLLEDWLREREEEYKAVLIKYGELQDRYVRLEHEHEVLKGRYEALLANYTDISVNYTLLVAGLRFIGINTDNIDELWKLNEVVISKTYLIYDYDEGRWRWYFWCWTSITHYLYERTRIIHEPMILEERVVEYSRALVEGYAHDPIIRDVANFLWMASRGDEEKFVNYVLQIVHQMPYVETLYAKSPIETLIEGTGDCDNLAILAAAIIRNRGLDTVLIHGIACDGSRCNPHAMIGVALSGPPSDLFEFGRRSYWYIEHNGKRYYVAEYTPIGGNPKNFDKPEIIGFFVGDNPWRSFQIEYVIEV